MRAGRGCRKVVSICGSFAAQQFWLDRYLGPIYRKDASYVLPLLSKSYPTRIWTKFESDNFKHRFGDNAVIPIRFMDTDPGYFSNDQNYGGVPFDPAGDRESQLVQIAETLCRRLVEDRQKDEARVVDEFVSEETVDNLARA
jgi:hypothetical protein